MTRGYLERRYDPDDLRSKRVYLTDRGESTREVIRDAVREVEAEWAAELGGGDLEQLRELLARLALRPTLTRRVGRSRVPGEPAGKGIA